MRRFVLFALLAAGLGGLAATRDAQACWWGHYRVVYYHPTYYCPPPIYYMPSYPAQPRYMAPARTVADVAAEDGRFEPKTITIAPGTTVRWTNRGKERHTVTSRDGRFDSGELAPGATFRATFLRPGTYRYYCRPHEKMGMEGTVVVSEAAGAAARPVTEVGAYDGRGFDPKTVTVAPGTTVRWTNHGKEGHTVTSRDGLFDSGELAPGATYRVTFNRAGTFRYYCKPHEKMGMVGTVVVSAANGAAGGAGAAAAKNTHDGTFVSASDETEFVMANGKEHTHTLSADAKVIGPDGKEAKLADFKKGQKIRVTTREGDMKTATRVEALKE